MHTCKHTTAIAIIAIVIAIGIGPTALRFCRGCGAENGDDGWSDDPAILQGMRGGNGDDGWSDDPAILQGMRGGDGDDPTTLRLWC